MSDLSEKWKKVLELIDSKRWVEDAEVLEFANTVGMKSAGPNDEPNARILMVTMIMKMIRNECVLSYDDSLDPRRPFIEHQIQYDALRENIGQNALILEQMIEQDCNANTREATILVPEFRMSAIVLRLRFLTKPQLLRRKLGK